MSAMENCSRMELAREAPMQAPFQDWETRRCGADGRCLGKIGPFLHAPETWGSFWEPREGSIFVPISTYALILPPCCSRLVQAWWKLAVPPVQADAASRSQCLLSPRIYLPLWRCYVFQTRAILVEGGTGCTLSPRAQTST